MMYYNYLILRWILEWKFLVRMRAFWAFLYNVTMWFYKYGFNVKGLPNWNFTNAQKRNPVTQFSFIFPYRGTIYLYFISYRVFLKAMQPTSQILNARNIKIHRVILGFYYIISRTIDGVTNTKCVFT